ncbi:capsule biosynthesis protein CapM [Mycobacterium sp. ACS1612]|uniref:glycosyltransferase family 4 protein n=1 Tax=Mycobacterium sp. ACS1612 TaxID=1834117 RepID=UPI0007FFF3B2|nr:glycosyltransferase family 4 protein [Mycobacterium sp. ACS1612]OBF41132.1 capsule biosynthesis protein CapM [Mycobacterium sp. ACS1612]
MVRLVHVTTVPQTLWFLEGQVGYLKARGVDVWALSSPGELLDQFAAREGVPVHDLEMPRRITPLRDMATTARLWRWLREVRPDIVDAHTPKGGLLGMVGAWLAHVPVRVYHMHGLPLMTATGLKRQLLRWAEKVSCLLAQEVLCVSASLQEAAVAEGLCQPDKITVLHHGSINGVDAETGFNPARVGGMARAAARARYDIPIDAEVIAFVGRVVRDKGLVELVEAWQILRAERPELHLLVVGPFESQDPLPPEVEELLRSDPRIHLTGRISDMPPMYTAMDVVVLPTYREGFGIVAIEAAAMELPVVATEVPGCVDAVQDSVTGTLVPSRDAAALTEAIRRYLLDPELRRRHGRAGRERVLRDFRQEDLWEQIYAEYTRLLQMVQRTR